MSCCCKEFHEAEGMKKYALQSEMYYKEKQKDIIYKQIELREKEQLIDWEYKQIQIIALQQKITMKRSNKVLKFCLWVNIGALILNIAFRWL